MRHVTSSSAQGQSPLHPPASSLQPPASVLACTGLTKHFLQGDTRVDVLNGVELSVAPGERLAIVGASGSGKTTLLQLLGGLDLPSSGKVTFWVRRSMN